MNLTTNPTRSSGRSNDRDRATRARLRPVLAADHDWLYHLLVVTAGSRWKFRGRTPSPAEFVAELWNGVHAQFVVTDLGGERAGLVGCYNSNLVAGHTKVFAVADTARGPLVTEGLIQFGSWAFDEFEFQKLWAEVPEFNLEQFAGIQRHATVEGRLSNHEYWHGRYWDLVVLSISAATWDAELRPSPQWAEQQLGEACALIDRTTVSRHVSELWPMDSLGVVELVARIEDELGLVVDYDLFDGLDGSQPERAAAQLYDRLLQLT